ncbi:MAG: 50S ribosomal protein L24 [Patescibacteria group bacterium]
MKIKKNDLVKIIAGKDLGKEGKVTQILISENKVVVEGVNKTIKNLKSRSSQEKGKKIEYFAPVHYSNIQVICPSCKKATKLGYKIDNNNKVRVCKKCNAVIN